MVEILALYLRPRLDVAPPAAMLHQALHAWRDCDFSCIEPALGSLIRKRLARRLPRVDLDEAQISIAGTTALVAEVSLWYGAADPGNPDELANADPDVTDALEELELFGVRPSVSRDIEDLSGLQGSGWVFKFTAKWRVPAETARTALGPTVLTAARLAVLERLVLQAPQEPHFIETYLERRRRRHVRLLQQEEKSMSITRPTPAQSAPQPAPAQTAPLPMREWKTGQRVFRADYSPGHGSLTIQQGIVRAAGPRRVTVEYVVGKSRSEERLEVEFSPRGWATTEDAAVQWLKESLRKEEERLTEQLDKLHTFQRTYLGRPQRLQDILGALADAEAKAVWAVLGEVLEDDEEAAEYVEAAKDRLALLKPVLERLTEVIAALAQPPSVPPPDQGAAATTRYQARSRAMKHLLNEQDVETVGGEVHLGSIFKEDWSAAERYGRALGLEGRPGGWIYLGAERLFQGWVKLATFLQQKKIVVSDQGGFVLRPPLRVGDRVVLKAPYRGYTAGYLSEIPPGGEVVSVALDGYRDTLWVDLPMTNLRSWRPATVAERAAALAALVAGPATVAERAAALAALVAGPDAPLRITTARGIPFTVSVEEGKRPLMVFFDMRNTEKFGPKGQKVAEYYADTLAQSRDGVGLALRLGNLDWTIDGPALAPVLALARTLNPAR